MAQHGPLRTAAAAIMAVAWLGGMVAPAGAAEKLRVGVNLTTIETLPVWLAGQEPEGERIVISGGNIPALTAGAVDVATHAELQAVRRSPANPDIRVVLTVAEYAYRIVASRSAGIQAVADLRGRRIATVPDTSAHFYLAKTLQNAGIVERDVTVVAMPPADMPAALARGDVDAVSIWEPAAEQAARALGVDVVILAGADYRERFDLNTTAAILADPARRAAVVDLVRAIIRTSQIARSHAEEVQPIIAAKLDLPVDVVAAAWGRFRFPASLPDDLLDVMVEEEPWMAARQNRPPRPRAALAALIDASVWREAQGQVKGQVQVPATSGSQRR
jgi:NitT/TauT family transport system substrate-binding protein